MSLGFGLCCCGGCPQILSACQNWGAASEAFVGLLTGYNVEYDSPWFGLPLSAGTITVDGSAAATIDFNGLLTDPRPTLSLTIPEPLRLLKKLSFSFDVVDVFTDSKNLSGWVGLWDLVANGNPPASNNISNNPRAIRFFGVDDPGGEFKKFTFHTNQELRDFNWGDTFEITLEHITCPLNEDLEAPDPRYLVSLFHESALVGTYEEQFTDELYQCFAKIDLQAGPYSGFGGNMRFKVENLDWTAEHFADTAVTLPTWLANIPEVSVVGQVVTFDADTDNAIDDFVVDGSGVTRCKSHASATLSTVENTWYEIVCEITTLDDIGFRIFTDSQYSGLGPVEAPPTWAVTGGVASSENHAALRFKAKSDTTKINLTFDRAGGSVIGIAEADLEVIQIRNKGVDCGTPETLDDVDTWDDTANWDE